jgi:hypothetical protein
MSGEIGSNSNAGIISAETVQLAYHDANPRWLVPSVANCQAIADILALHRSARIGMEVFLAKKSEADAAGRRRMRRHDTVRTAIGTLLRDLPELVEWAPGHIAPAGGLHASSLTELLGAVRQVAAFWPSLDGSIRRFDRRSRWALRADCLVGMLLAAWRKANPTRRIGKPLKEDQPSTKLLMSLLGLVESHALSAEQVAKHFNRQKLGFILIDSPELHRKT